MDSQSYENKGPSPSHTYKAFILALFIWTVIIISTITFIVDFTQICKSKQSVISYIASNGLLAIIYFKFVHRHVNFPFQLSFMKQKKPHAFTGIAAQKRMRFMNRVYQRELVENELLIAEQNIQRRASNNNEMLREQF